jgi:hypothetical protein
MLKEHSMSHKPSVVNFDTLPDSAVVDINTAVAVTGRSRNSVYRHIKAGDLTAVKLGFSTRLRVSELRRLIGAKAS